MRSSLIPRSLILVASAALSFGACGTEPPPGTGTNSSTAGTPTTVVAGTPAVGGAGTPGSGTAGGGAKAGTGGSIATVTAGTSGAAGTPAAVAGTSGAAGTAAGAAGTAAGAAGAAGGAAGGGAVTFTKVFEDVILGTGCGVGACHGNPMVPSKLGLSDKTVAYTALVGVKAAGSAGPGAATGGGCAGMPLDRVKAGDPDNSLLIQKLEKKQTCGTEMPPGGMLKPEQIKLVRDWIMAGAKND